MKKLPDEIKKEIISYLDRKCFKCDKKIYFLKGDKYYEYYPSDFDNINKNLTGYTICPLCLFRLQMISRFSKR